MNFDGGELTLYPVSLTGFYGGVSDFNVVPATLQGLSGICYTDFRLHRLAYCQKHLKDISWLSKVQSLLTKPVLSLMGANLSYT